MPGHSIATNSNLIYRVITNYVTIANVSVTATATATCATIIITTTNQITTVNSNTTIDTATTTMPTKLIITANVYNVTTTTTSADTIIISMPLTTNYEFGIGYQNIRPCSPIMNSYKINPNTLSTANSKLYVCPPPSACNATTISKLFTQKLPSTNYSGFYPTKTCVLYYARLQSHDQVSEQFHYSLFYQLELINYTSTPRHIITTIVTEQIMQNLRVSEHEQHSFIDHVYNSFKGNTDTNTSCRTIASSDLKSALRDPHNKASNYKCSPVSGKIINRYCKQSPVFLRSSSFP